MEDSGSRRPPKVRSGHITNKKVSYSWVFFTLFLTFFLSLTIGFIAGTLMTNVAVGMAFFILFMVILLGVVFDMVGIAFTAAIETPFHSMASSRVRGAEQTIKLIRNAEKVSNVCNDVVGDIAGIVSGTMATAIASHLLMTFQSWNVLWLSLILTAIIASLTVGGKALGKTMAMSNCNSIVYGVGFMLSFFWPSKHSSKRKKKKDRAGLTLLKPGAEPEDGQIVNLERFRRRKRGADKE